ncbi:MAG: hypothetical protein HZC29_03675, partial [Thaumarchaeota archaeon]|nr:hypothetical protein [Nitrososphaerota archaeon]
EFNERLLVPLPEDFDGKSGSEAETYVKAVLDTYRQKKPTGAIDGVIIDNVILSDSFRSDFLLNKQDTSGQQKMFGVGGPIIQSTNKATDTVNSNSIGKWFVADKTTGIPVGGDNQFVFANPLGLSALEKTTIKYQPCGANALCLKTPERVYRYPLDQCSDIKAVQLYYDTRNDLSESKKAFWKIPLGFAIIFGKRFGLVGKSVGGVIFEDGLADYFQVFNSLRESDFSLVSPCKLTTDLTTSPPLDVTIHKGSCDSVKIPNFEAEKPCSMFVSYPIFSYDPSNDKFHKVGTHNACVDSIGTDVNVPSSSQEHLYQPTDQCIQVIVTKYLEGYCWTPNTYKKNIGLEFTTGITSRILFGIPIFDNSAYLQMGVVILKGVQAAQSGEGFFPDQGKRFWWGWPGF